MIKQSIKSSLAGDALNEKICVQGWVRTRRDSKAGFSFIALNDGSSFHPIQIIAPAEMANYADEVMHLTTGCAIRVEGTLVESQGKGQKFEIQADKVDVLGMVEDPETYPVQPKRHTMEFLRSVAHLRPRTNTFLAVNRVRHSASQTIHRYFHERDFFWVNTPIITASDCEGAGDLFRVSTLDLLNTPTNEQGAVDYKQDFFGAETFLTVSGQLNIETHCMALNKCYTFGPTFRAENSNTTRHLAEFWMVEPEIAFADLNDLADLAEDFLKYVFKSVLEECPDEMAFFAQHIEKSAISRLEQLSEDAFVRLDYAETIEILQKTKKKFEFPVNWGLDLQTEHERYLTEEHFKKPVVVMNYPDEIKAFYMRQNDDGKTVAAMDVLAPGIGEIIGGSQREERLDVLTERMLKHHIDPEQYSWYLDLRRYGTAPHGGFGLGFERLVSYITGMANIRDVIPFPRTPGNADF